MRKPVKIALIGGALVLVLALAWGLYLLILAGELSPIEPRLDADCHRVEGVIGPEDIVHTHADGTPAGVLLVSSDDRRATIRGEPVRGAIHVLDLDPASEPDIYDASGGQPALFHPHGLGLTPEDAERERLFVVNHPRASLFGQNDESEGPGHTIEIFDVVSERGRVRLVHAQTVADELLVSPNDVAPIDGERFYVTNDHGSRGAFGHKLEDYGHLARGHVLYWDGAAFSTVAEGIHFANGIGLSRDGAAVYVAAVTNSEVLVFDREPESGALSLRERVEVRGPDNISVAEDGSLWIGGHPKLLSFSAYAKDASKRSPSMVSRVVPTAGGEWTVEELFVSEGSEISGSSVALGCSTACAELRGELPNRRPGCAGCWRPPRCELRI